MTNPSNGIQYLVLDESRREFLTMILQEYNIETPFVVLINTILERGMMSPADRGVLQYIRMSYINGDLRKKDET